jgi:hypothetical protein
MFCVVLACGGGLMAALGATGTSLAGLLFQSGAILVSEFLHYPAQVKSLRQ